jgi:hypothetical protein
MAKRPSLSEQSFLGHVFSPKKNPKPAGIRKTTLTGVKGGRTKGRLNAFNRMSPTNQELLKRAGMREQYLKGEVKLGDAKAALRPKAVSLGVARPGRPRPGSIRAVIRTPLDARVAAHLKHVVRSAGRPLNTASVDKNVRFIPDDVLPDVETWEYGQVRYAGRPGSEYEVTSDGKPYNPFWYH